MVFFTCNACGESVKKIQVEKHVSVCRNCECLSCIDCGKDFWGDDYKNHVKCISEDQKYGGKGYEGKTHKGDVKQQAWIQKINELIKKPSVNPKVRELLEQIGAFDNVPRKKVKFQNWMKNSLKVYNESILEQVWTIFSEASSSEPVSKGQDQQPPEEAAKPNPEVAAKLPLSNASGPLEEQAQVKKNKRERKEERQKNTKKGKKELKLENHQEDSKSQKPKKHRKGQDTDPGADGEEALKANGSSGKKGKKRQGQGKQVAEGEDAAGAETKPAVGKRKQKHLGGEADSKKRRVTFPGYSDDGEPEDGEAPVKGSERKRKDSGPTVPSRAAPPAPDLLKAPVLPPVPGKFNWKGTIKAVLRQAPDNELSIKKLKKKVLAQYYTVTSDSHRPEDELLVIFNKKISKNPCFRLLKDKVKLLK